MDIFLFSFVNVKTNIIVLIYFYLENLFFYFINTRHPLHILVPGERLVFLFFFLDGGMYTYTYKKIKKKQRNGLNPQNDP